MADPAQVRRDGDALVFAGALLRADVPGLWALANRQTAGLRRLDLQGVTGLDSAGLAMLSALAASGAGEVTIIGNPIGLEALSAAYRLDASLSFGDQQSVV